MAKYISGKVKDLNVGISNYSENKTSVTVIGNVGIGTNVPTDPVGSGNTAVLAAGIVSAYQFYGDGSNITGVGATDKVVTESLDVLGISTLRGTLSVAGVATFSSAIDANGDLDVDGHTELDDVNISGITTVGSLVGISGSLTNINVTGIGTFAQLNVTGVGTFASAIRLASSGSDDGVVDLADRSGTLFLKGGSVGSGKVRIQGHAGYDNIVANSLTTPGSTEIHFAASDGTGGKKLETTGVGITVYGNIVGDNSTDITGISSVFATKFYGDGSNLTNLPGIDTTGGSVFNDLYVTGLSTFVGQIDADAGLTVAGVSTFSGYLNAASRLYFDQNTGTKYMYGSGANILTKIGSEGDFKVTLNNSGGTGGDFIVEKSSGNSLLEAKGIGEVDILGDLNVTGVSTFAGDVSIGGTLTYEDVTNIDSIGIITAREGIRIGAGKSIGSDGAAAVYYGDGSNLSGVTTAGGSPTAWIPDADENLVAGTLAGEDLDGTSGCFNVLIGQCAGKEMTSGSCNIAIGKDALSSSALTGNSNVAMGPEAGYTLCSGDKNVLIGQCAGRALYNTDGNVLIGDRAGLVYYCSDSVFIGNSAGLCKYIGHHNIALGSRSMAGNNGGSNSDNTGAFNITLGYRAGNSIASGDHNLFVGMDAGYGSCLTGDRNIFLGKYTAAMLTSGSENIGFGNEAGMRITEGNNNIAIGSSSLSQGCVTGDNNIAIGSSAGYQVSTGENNIILGCMAGIGQTNANDNIIMGQCAGYNVNAYPNAYCGGEGYGCQNVIIGSNAGIGYTSHDRIVAIGYQAGKAAITNSYYGENGSVNIGYKAGCGYGGCSGISIGDRANGTGTADGYGGFGIAIGKEAKAGSQSIAIGCGAGNGSNGNDSRGIIIGVGAGQALYSSWNNIFIGCYAGRCVAYESANNLYLGSSAGHYMTKGCCSVIIGAGVTQAPVNDGSNLSDGCQLVIGVGTTSWIIGNKDFNVGIGTTNPDAPVTSGNTQKLSVGILSAYQLYGDGSNLTGTGGETLISGITVQEESSTVGTGGSITILDFQGASVTATASGANKAVITVAAGGGSTDGWIQDSQGNLFAGTAAGAARDADTCFNIGIGQSAGKVLNEGDGNIFLGCFSGRAVTSGSHNVSIGELSGGGWQSATCNVSIGYKAGCDMSATTAGNVNIGAWAGMYGRGGNNVYIGRCANAAGVNYGSSSVIIGAWAGNCNQSGENTYVGGGAGYYSKGQFNTLLGYYAGGRACGSYCSTWVGAYSGCGTGTEANYTGDCNVGMGNRAGRGMTSGHSVVMIGNEAGCKNSSGSQNVYLGQRAAYHGETGSCNVAIGNSVFLPITNGDSQLVIGVGSSLGWINGNANMNVGIGTTNPDLAVGVGNTAKLSVGILSAYQLYGDGSGLTNVGSASTNAWIQDSDANLVAGTGAGAALDSGNTCCNILIGCNAGNALNTGDRNIAIGWKSGEALESGYANVFLGTYAGDSVTTGFGNFMGGYNVGCNQIEADYNVFLGHAVAANRVVTGNCNIAIGRRTARNLTSGEANIFMGYYAAEGGLVSGSNNIIMGKETGEYLSTGGNNITLGYRAGKHLCTASCHIIMGYEAGCCAEPSGESILIGFRAGMGYGGKHTGFSNIVIGSNAGCSLQSGQHNTIVGNYAGKEATSGNSNTFVGKYAGACGTGSSFAYNTFLGCGAGKNVTTGERNIVVGCGAYLPRSTGSDQIVFTGGYGTFGQPNDIYWFYGCCNGGCTHVGIGTTNPDDVVGAGVTSKLSVGIVSAYQLYGDGQYLTNVGGASTDAWAPDSQGNLVAGTDAGAARDADTTCNIIIGQGAGKSLNNGDCNVFIGFCAGEASTQSSRVVAIGYKAAQCLTDTNNVLIGSDAGRKFCRGQGNVAIGYEALYGGCAYQQEIDHSIFIGQEAGKQVCCGADAIWMGCKVGAGVTHANEGNIWLGRYAGGGSGTAPGPENIFIGRGTGKDITTGACNIFLGYYAGTNIEGGHLNVAIGRGAGQLATSGSSNVFLGRYAGCTMTTGGANVAIGCRAGCSSLTATGNAQLAIGNGSDNWISGDSSYNVTVNDISASNFNSTSDIRLKTNIQPIGNPIGKVKQIEGVSFNWKKDDKPALGVIADQVEKILPELVHGDDPKTVNYNGLIGLLIETVKEQQNQIDELNNRISKLE